VRTGLRPVRLTTKDEAVNMGKNIGKLLADLDIKPVLMDIGASGAPPVIWNQIAPYSTYVGFDPDLREIHENQSAGFRRSVIINEAITSDKGAGEVNFYLTRSPFCSTVLAPNPPATYNWLESNLFDVEKVVSVRATTIDSVLKRLDMPGIDWIKVDSQGTDLRLINSISPDVLTRVMAIDTEPGLIDIYQHEDLFVDVHRDLTSKGFWLSGMHVGGFVRMRRSTLKDSRKFCAKMDDIYVRKSVRTSPAYLEARYLRTLEWLAQHSFSQREYLLLWIFALIDNQLGFALDLSIESERIFNDRNAFGELKAATWLCIKRAHQRNAMQAASSLVRRCAKALLSRVR
jgi:FkbM family methyltransferase